MGKTSALRARPLLCPKGSCLPCRGFIPSVRALIWDTRAGKAISDRALMDQLAQADVVFVGEQHDDPAAHTLELEILQVLHTSASGHG